MDPNPITIESISRVAAGALDREPVSGWTHNFYRYPARFSPKFAAAVIDSFSKSGDVILDPYMGGGTVIVEGIAAGRNVVGNDLNSLARFITKVKTTPLQQAELRALERWAEFETPDFSYRDPAHRLARFIDLKKTKNLTLVRARFIKKCIAAALASILNLPTGDSQDFARCAVLRCGQWALDGRARHTSLSAFREKLKTTTMEMLAAIGALAAQLRRSGGSTHLLNLDAAVLDIQPMFQSDHDRVSLVVTSPPYPGVHVLYHRWQVDGRRETPAPYWIAGCNDGQGASFYNFGDRRETAADNYFQASLITLKAIRRVMKNGGYMIQMVAFNRPEDQLPRYLANMVNAGFKEASIGSNGRIWRQVPNRKWHATLRGKTHSANEVVLIHQAS